MKKTELISAIMEDLLKDDSEEYIYIDFSNSKQCEVWDFKVAEDIDGHPIIVMTEKVF